MFHLVIRINNGDFLIKNRKDPFIKSEKDLGAFVFFGNISPFL